jgi:hypothetical protein
MWETVMKVVAIIALPTVAFLGGAWLMKRLSDRQVVANQKPLNMRYFGYNLEAVKAYWGAQEKTNLPAEQRLLELDLIFPFLYGGALAVGLFMAWAMLGRPFNPLFILAPICITMIADWTENLNQLHQLKAYMAGGEAAVQSGSIWLASLGTIVKLWFFTGTSFFGHFVFFVGSGCHHTLSHV